MRVGLIILLLITAFGVCVAQKVGVQFLDSAERAVFEKEGWQLHFGVQNKKPVAFALIDSHIVLLEETDKHIKIARFNDEGLSVSAKTFKKRAKNLTESPILLQNANQVVFGPINGQFYQLGPNNVNFQRISSPTSALPFVESLLPLGGDKVLSLQAGIQNGKASYQLVLHEGKADKVLHSLILNEQYVRRGYDYGLLNFFVLDNQQIVVIDKYALELFCFDLNGELLLQRSIAEEMNLKNERFSCLFDQAQQSIYLLDYTSKRLHFISNLKNDDEPFSKTLLFNINRNISRIYQAEIYTIIHDPSSNMYGIYKLLQEVD
jgi:hypothetical protein